MGNNGVMTDANPISGNTGANSVQDSGSIEGVAVAADEPAVNRRAVAGRSAAQRSRVTNGSKILPTVSGNSVWARLLRDTRDAMVAHLGGEAVVSETQRLAVRRVAAFEAELIFLENKFAGLRHAGKEPDREDLVLYNTLANGQRRFCEGLGWNRVPRDLTPELSTYLRAQPPPGDSAVVVDAGSIKVDATDTTETT